MKKIIEKMFVSPTLLRVLRVFRIGRILRLIKSAKGIRTLLFSLAVSMPALFNIGLLLFLITFIYAIFGMSFFMHVKHNSGLDELFNFETCYRGMMVLFQVSTSAGWDAVLAGLMIEPPDCNSTSTEVKPNGNCGNIGMAILFLVTYLIITFLVVINMYIAVILENFSQATEDVEQGLTQDDFDMYYEVWERFDETATQYIHLSRLSEFVEALEEPLKLPSPNRFRLIALDIPICDGDRMHCIDILDALTKNFLGTPLDTTEMVDLKKSGLKRRDYTPVSSTLRRQRQNYCAIVIQNAWREYLRRQGRPYPPRRAPVVVCGPPTVTVAAAEAGASQARRVVSVDDKSNRGLSDGLRKVIRLQLSVIPHPAATAAVSTSPQAPATAPAAFNAQ